MEKLTLENKWDKTFLQSENVTYKKVTFTNHFGITLAERGYVTVAFDPNFCGESGGQPRYMNSPDINTEDFQTAVDFLGTQPNVDAERICIIGICGWGGFALNTATS